MNEKRSLMPIGANIPSLKIRGKKALVQIASCHIYPKESKLPVSLLFLPETLIGLFKRRLHSVHWSLLVLYSYCSIAKAIPCHSNLLYKIYRSQARFCLRDANCSAAGKCWYRVAGRGPLKRS